MRKYRWLAGLVIGLGLTGTANAQIASWGPSILGPFKSTPFDYRNVNAPIGGALPRSNQFSLTSMFTSSTKLSSAVGSPISGKSTFPTPAQMNSSAPAYFKAFQMYGAQRIPSQ
jgi:hypothetical protein